jgi:hypothetical protein
MAAMALKPSQTARYPDMTAAKGALALRCFGAEARAKTRNVGRTVGDIMAAIIAAQVPKAGPIVPSIRQVRSVTARPRRTPSRANAFPTSSM